MHFLQVYLRLDQPNTALQWYATGCEHHPNDTHLRLGIARVHDQLNDMERGVTNYKMVLELDSTNIEAIACLAANHFYEDHPEVALRLYHRLLQVCVSYMPPLTYSFTHVHIPVYISPTHSHSLTLTPSLSLSHTLTDYLSHALTPKNSQMGVVNTELWNNMGLCCFYASQYDMALSCFERALALASDDNMADVWYNIGEAAVGIGDLSLAYQAFKLAVSVDPNHSEAYNNLGVQSLYIYLALTLASRAHMRDTRLILGA